MPRIASRAAFSVLSVDSIDSIPSAEVSGAACVTYASKGEVKRSHVHSNIYRRNRLSRINARTNWHGCPCDLLQYGQGCHWASLVHDASLAITAKRYRSNQSLKLLLARTKFLPETLSLGAFLLEQAVLSAKPVLRSQQPAMRHQAREERFPEAKLNRRQ